MANKEEPCKGECSVIRLRPWAITVIVTILAQTIGLVIWGATLTERVNSIQRSIVAIELRQHETLDDKDRSVIVELISSVNKRIELAERRIERFEGMKNPQP